MDPKIDGALGEASEGFARAIRLTLLSHGAG